MDETATVGTVATALPSFDEKSGIRPRASRRRFYVALTLFMIVGVFAGFWTYLGPLLRGVLVERPWIVHLHGAVFLGWMALLVTQALLVSTGRTRLHRKLGVVGIAFGVAVLLVRIAVSFGAPFHRLTSGEWPMDQAARLVVMGLADRSAARR